MKTSKRTEFKVNAMARERFREAIRIWKSILALVNERDAREILPKVEKAYRTLGYVEGIRAVNELKGMFEDLFRDKEMPSDGRGPCDEEYTKLIRQIRQAVEDMPDG